MKLLFPANRRRRSSFGFALAVALPFLLPRPSGAQQCTILSLTSGGTLTFWASETNLYCGLEYRAGLEAPSCWQPSPGSFGNFTNTTPITTLQIPLGDIESDRTFFRVSCSTNHPPIPPEASTFSSWEVVDCILTNTDTERIIYEASPLFLPKGMAIIYGVWTNTIGATRTYGYIAGAVGTNLKSLTRIGPLLSPTPGEWDSGFVSPGRLYTEGGTNYLFYFGATNQNEFEGGATKIGIAFSTDGTNWIKGPNNPIISPFNTTTAGTNFVKDYVMSCIKLGNTYHGFYNGTRWLGNGHVREEIACAYADNIFGPWTPAPQRPIIVNSNGLDSVVADPVVFPLNGGGWGMVFREWYTGQKSKPAFAWSWDLTNWFGRDLNGDYGVPWNSQHPLAVPGTTELYGGGFSQDAGPAMLVDDLAHIYLLRPSRVLDCKAPVWRVDGGNKARADILASATYPRFMRLHTGTNVHAPTSLRPQSSGGGTLPH